MPPQPTPSIPAHLPEKLSICCWIWSWITSALPEEPYGDLQQAMAGLAERGFNTIRVDAGLNWCFRPDGRPRGPMRFGPWIAGHSDNLRTVNAKGGACHDVLQRVVRLMELARQYDVYVILTSWEYQDSTWFVADPDIRREVYGIPEADRLMHLARHHDRLLGLLKDRGLADHVAFVEVHNEVEYSDFPKGPEGTRLHAEAIAFLRERHPDILIAADSAKHCPETIPDNTQVYDQHVYAGADLFFKGLYQETVRHPDFDPKDPKKLPALRRLLKQDIVPYEEFMKPAQNIRESWRPIMWLYQNIDNAAYDQWMREHLRASKPAIRDVAAQVIEADAREAARRGIPAVIDEGGYFYPPLGSRFEESEEGMWLFEWMADLAIRHRYWGFMPTTYCGPEQPVWQEHPRWLRAINTRFQAGKESFAWSPD